MSATTSPRSIASGCRRRATRPRGALGVRGAAGLVTVLVVVACGQGAGEGGDAAARDRSAPSVGTSVDPSGGPPAGTSEGALEAPAGRSGRDAPDGGTPVGRQANGGGATPALSPLGDTIAQRLVFAPVEEEWFTAAARARRLLVDLGRIDIDLGKDSLRLAAYREAAAATSPFPTGTRLRLRGPWGSDDATITGFDAWNGRIVATLATAPRVDSIARITDPLVASAHRRVATDSGGATAACGEPAGDAFVARLKALARATEDSLRSAEDQPIYARLRSTLKARRSTATGCFGAARGVVIVTLYAGDYEWVRERVLLVGDTRTVRAAVRDLRFRAHEALHALDADGDGVDDLAARAWTPRGGGTVILRLADGTRFERLASGFAWER